MGTYSIIPCCEEFNTQSENWTKDGCDCSVVLRCDWINRHSLVADILGNQRVWPHGASGSRATSAGIASTPTIFVTSGQSCEYLDALVTVAYSTEEEDLLSESLEPTAEFITLDYKRFRWSGADGDPLLEGEAPGKLVRNLNLVRNIMKIVDIPVATLDLPGSVNHEDYVSALLGLTFPAETLLFQPPAMSRTITTAGAKAWNLNLKFSYKPWGWNKYWRSKTETYERIYIVGMSGADPYNMYPLNDFSDFLF